MTNIFSKFHDFFLEDYLENFKSDKNDFIIEQTLFGRTKFNYIFPFKLSIKVKIFIYFRWKIFFEVIQSMMRGLKLIGRINLKKYTKNYGFLILNNEGIIDGISASFIIFL